MCEIGVGATLVERYVLEREAGRGTFGLVFRARRLADSATVAVKMVTMNTPERAARFMREAKMLAAIHHPHIVEIFEVDQLPDGRAFQVTNWVEGLTLHDLHVAKRVSLTDVVVVGIVIADALAAAHAAGVLHRDVKPANVLVPIVDDLPRFDETVLVDFGHYGEVRQKLPHFVPRLGAGRISGTVCYMAPEQLLGRAQTFATDVYGLGALLFELIFRAAPMAKADGQGEYVVKVGERELTIPVHLARITSDVMLPSVPPIPEQLSDCLLGCLDRDPDQRIQSASMVADRLRRVLDSIRIGSALG